MSLLPALDARLQRLRAQIKHARQPDERWDLQTEELAVIQLRNAERRPHVEVAAAVPTHRQARKD